MAKIRIGIMYSDAVMAEARRMLLGTQKDFDVVYSNGVAQSGIDEIVDAEIDVLVVDTRLRGSSGVDFTARLHRRYLTPDSRLPKVVITAPYFTAELLMEAINSGATDLVAEADGAEGLIQAIRAAVEVVQVTSYKDLKDFFDIQGVQPGSNERWLLRLTGLSGREQDVLSKLQNGLVDSKVAEQLSLSEVQVRKSIEGIMAKLGVATRAQMALALYEAGVLYPAKKPAK